MCGPVARAACLREGSRKEEIDSGPSPRKELGYIHGVIDTLQESSALHMATLAIAKLLPYKGVSSALTDS